MRGERPARPRGAQKLGLVKSVWDMTVDCWQQDPVRRPTIAEVVTSLRGSSVVSLFMKQIS